MSLSTVFETVPLQSVPPDQDEASPYFEEFESGRRRPTRRRPASSYVSDFSGPAAECARSLRRAGKTKAQALKIINTQIGIAVALLRKAAADLKRKTRGKATRDLFLKIFRIRPEFVPTWFKPTASNRDRGDVVAIRCSRTADLLASRKISFFCTINATNCPDCANDSSDFACSSWGAESVAPRSSRVICLGDAFWAAMKAGDTESMLATLMHEPFHIYFGVHVTGHRSTAGKFGGINCIVQYVFEANRRTAPARVTSRCSGIAVRRELETEFEMIPPWPLPCSTGTGSPPSRLGFRANVLTEF